MVFERVFKSFCIFYTTTFLKNVEFFLTIQRGRAVRSARRAHNPEVGGSNPPLAIFFNKLLFISLAIYLNYSQLPFKMLDKSSEIRWVSHSANAKSKPVKVSRPLIYGFIFDLDGVLLDNRHECYSSVKKVLDHYGVGKGFTEDKYRDIWGGSIDEFWKTAGIPDKVSLEEVDNLFWDFFYKTRPHKIFEGTGEALHTLVSKRGLVLGMVTAAKKEYMDEFLGMPAFGDKKMGDLFKCVRPNCRNGKKHEIYFMASVLGLDRNNTAYVDDSPDALQAAADVGIFPIGMLEGHASEERIIAANPEPAHFNIRSPVDLVDILKNYL